MRGQLLAHVSVSLSSYVAGGFRASGDIVKPTAKTTTKTV